MMIFLQWLVPVQEGRQVERGQTLPPSTLLSIHVLNELDDAQPQGEGQSALPRAVETQMLISSGNTLKNTPKDVSPENPVVLLS